VSVKVDLAVPLLVDDKRFGKHFATTGFMAGREAQMMPVYTSMLDQMEAPTLSSKACISLFVDSMPKKRRSGGLQVGSADIEMT
jgi:hypothetical protein